MSIEAREERLPIYMAVAGWCVFAIIERSL